MGPRESKHNSPNIGRINSGSHNNDSTAGSSTQMIQLKSENSRAAEPLPVWPENSARWQKLYDVYICHSESATDLLYAKEMLSYLEEQPEGLRCFLPLRDMEAGLPLSTEMCRGAESSHCWVMLLTPRFLSDSWCKYQMHQFLTQDPCGEGRIIPVLMGLTFSQYPSEMKHMYAFRGSLSDKSVFSKIKSAILTYLKKLLTVTIDQVPSISATSDMAMRSSATQESTSDMPMRSSTTQESTSDLSVRSSTTQESTSDMSVRSSTTQESTSDMAIRSSTTQETTCDMSVRSCGTQESTNDMSVRSYGTQESTSDISMRISTTRESACDMSVNSTTTQEITSDMSVRSSTTQESMSDISRGAELRTNSSSKVSLNSVTPDSSINQSLRDHETDEFSTNRNCMEKTKICKKVQERPCNTEESKASFHDKNTDFPGSLTSRTNKDSCSRCSGAQVVSKDSHSCWIGRDTSCSRVQSVTMDLHAHSRDLYTSCTGAQAANQDICPSYGNLYTSCSVRAVTKDTQHSSDLDTHSNRVVSDAVDDSVFPDQCLPNR